MTRLTRRSPVVLAGFALLLAINTVTADDKCRTGCRHGNKQNTFKYAEGTTYKYNLEGNVDFELSTAEGQLSTTKIKATVLLTQQAQCNQVLSVKDFQLFGADAKKYTIDDVESKSIKINFHDGHIEDVICTENGDTQNSLNIKRAIASLFQSAVEHGYETDVFGTCPTDTSQHKEGNVLVIQKSRRLNRCSHRETVHNDFISTAFNLNSELKSSPVLSSKYTAEQRVKNGILDQVLITETYLFLPFAAGGKQGAKAVVTTKLHLAGTTKDTNKAAISVPRSIIFENPHPVQVKTADVKAILAAVKETAKTITDTVGENTANKFANLIRIVAAASKDDLLTLFSQIKSGAGFSDKTVGKKVFLDALFRAGSGASIEVAVQLLKSKQLEPLEQTMVYLGLAFVKHATPNSLTAAATLLDQPKLPREAYLSIGTLAGRYCSAHPAQCDSSPQVSALIAKLLTKLGDSKPTTRDQENTVVSVLKALGNAGHLTDAAAAKITALAQDKKGAIRVRVAAIEAFSADACKDKVRDSAVGLLKDVQQDAEIRIKAYLALVECPTGKVANVVKTVLDAEQSYQVGGFIVSHLRNLRATANPDRALAQAHLAQISTHHKFPVDPRRFSFSTDLSYSLDTIGLASSAETSVIYSQNSFLPRSACVNLTSEVFGHRVNLIEVDMRQENLDRLLEHYLGPLGVFRGKETEDVLKEGKTVMDDLVSQVKARFEKTRSKRDIAKEIETIGKQVEIKTNELNNDLDLDLSIKLFGSELLFLSINEDSQRFTPSSIINQVFDRLDSGIEHAKKFEHTIRNNLKFLDLELSYPTSMGFPLRLAVEGSSSTQLKASGSVDLKAILLSSQKDHLFKLSLIPSANIELVARLTMDAQQIDSGLKFSPTLHTATGGAIEVEFFNSGKGVDVKFSLPVEKQQLVSVSYDIVFNNRELGKLETNSPIKFAQNKDFSICVDQLSPIIGITLCAEMNGPAGGMTDGDATAAIVPWALAGNSKLAVTIEKEEEHQVDDYHYRNVLHMEPGKNGLEILFETRGKNKFSIRVDAFAAPDRFIKATLVSSIKTATLEGRITDTAQEKSAQLAFEHDGFKYSGKVGVAITKNGGKSIYKPLIEYWTPENKNAQTPAYTVEGQIIADLNGDDIKYIFDNVRVIIPNQAPFTVTGNAGREAGSYFTDLQLGDGAHTGTVRGRILAKVGLVKFSGELQNSINPDVNFNAKYELKYDDKDSFESTLQLIHGADLSSKLNIFKLHNKFSKKFRKIDDYEIEAKNEFSYPLIGVDAKLEFENTPKSLNYDCELKYNNVKLGSELELKYNTKTHGDYAIEFELYGFENKVSIKGLREITGDKSRIENTVAVNGQRVVVSGLINHHVKPQDLDVGADLSITVPQRNEPIKWSNSIKLNPSALDSHIKITSGSQTFIDAFLKVNRARDVNGSVKITVAGVLTAQGQIKAVKGVGNGNIVLEVIKGGADGSGRKIKAETQFTVTGTNVVNVAVTVHPNYEKDATKFTVNSENELTPESIKSKNVVNCCDKQLTLSFSGTRTGHLLDGVIAGEAELTLPNDLYLAGKLNRELHVVAGVTNGNIKVQLEQRDNKNAAGRKLVWSGEIKDSKFNEGLMDIKYGLDVTGAGGDTLNGELAVKRVKGDGDKIVADVKGKLASSKLANPLEFESSSSYKDRVGDYHVKSNYGPKNTFDIKGTYDGAGHGKPIAGDFTLEINSDNPKIKTIKINAGGSALKPQSHDQQLELSGKFGIFIDDDGSTKDATVDIKTEGAVKLGHHKGDIKGSLNFQKQPPLNIALTYDHATPNPDNHNLAKCHGTLLLDYAPGKRVTGDITLDRTKPLEYTVDLNVQTPEQIKDLKVHLTGKRSEDWRERSGEMTVNADGKVYKLTHDVFVSEQSPRLSVVLTRPDGKQDMIVYKANGGTKNFDAELKAIYTPKDFTFDGSLAAHLATADDFSLKLSLNSPALHMDAITLETKSEPGKKISVAATAAGANLLSGAATYKIREEAGKYIVEGSGNFKLKDKDQSGNFKYMRHTLNRETDGETGVEISFDAGLGVRAIDAEFKATNKQFRVLNSYCEEKKQCAHFEIDSKTNNDLEHFSNVLEVNIDLRKLGLSHEFGLKAVTARKSEWQIEHTVDVHFQSKDDKYQYSVYIRPREAGVSLTTPKRIVALEATSELTIEAGKPSKAEIAIYLNKKTEPAKKTSLSYQVKRNGDEKIGGADGELKFVTPGLKKPMSITFKTTYDNVAKKYEYVSSVDIFATANQKIDNKVKFITTFDTESGKYGYNFDCSSNSAGLNFNAVYAEHVLYDLATRHLLASAILKHSLAGAKYDTAIIIDVAPLAQSVQVKYYGTDLFTATSKIQEKKDVRVIDGELFVFGTKPVVGHMEIKNWNSVKWILYHKDAPGKKLTLSAALIPGQVADLRATIQTTDLIHLSTKLDEKNFLRTEYTVKLEEIRKLVLEPLRIDAEAAAKESKVLLEDLATKSSGHAQKFNEVAKEHLPEFEPVAAYYRGELEKLKEEIVADKTIQEIAEFLKNIFGTAANIINDIVIRSAETVEQLINIVKTNAAKLEQIFSQDIVPKLREIANKIAGTFAKLFEALSDVTFTIIAKFTEFLDAHQPELKQLATALSTLGQDIGRLVMINYAKARELIMQNFNRIYEELKALPIYEELKSRYDALVEQYGGISEPLIAALQETAATLKDMIPDEEVKKIVNSFMEYVIKKLRMEPVNDLQILEAIVHDILVAIKKLLHSVQIKDLQLSEKNFWSSLTGGNAIFDLPKLAALKFSPLSYLTSISELPNLRDILYSVSFNPLQFTPPFQMYAIILNGVQIFTYDGKHLIFPGKCNYLLARDAQDGNFTLVGTFANGIITALTLSDKASGGTVTVKKDGHVQLNGAASEYPVVYGKHGKENHLVVYRLYNGVVLRSRSGIQAECRPDLSGCVIGVSGWYHGKVRGLLGNGNSESYDDFTLPNSKIISAEADFANAYKMTPSCAAVKTVDHKTINRAEECTRYFSGSADSQLRLCFPFVSVDNFRTACDHGVASGVKDAVKNAVLGYVGACYSRMVPVKPPAEFMECTNSEKPYAIGDTFSVKTPAKAVDIIVIVDRAKVNEPLYKDLMQPLLAQLATEFSANGITDLEYHLISYGGSFSGYPIHQTVNGKLTWKGGKSPVIHFAEPEPLDKVYNTGCPHLDGVLTKLHEAKSDVSLALGLDIQSRTFVEALNYPFRAHALKSLLVLTSAPCRQGKLIALQKLRTKIFKTEHVTVNLITPFSEFKVRDVKTTKSVIGFNGHSVFTFADAKKKPEGGSELHKDLEYDDYCVDWTVKQRGNVFVADNFSHAKGPARKQFAQVVSHNIIDQLLNVEQGLDCECKMTSLYEAANVCSVQYSKDSGKGAKKGGGRKKK